MPRSTPRRGFSLVELVLMLGIISIMAAIAGPRYANSLQLYRAQAAAQRIAADVNMARWQARASSQGQSVVFNLAANTYTLPGMKVLPERPSPYTVSIAGEPYSATFASVGFGQAQTLAFDRYGQPSAGGTVTVRSGSAVKTVTVDPDTGLVSVQ